MVLLCLHVAYQVYHHSWHITSTATSILQTGVMWLFKCTAVQVELLWGPLTATQINKSLAWSGLGLVAKRGNIVARCADTRNVSEYFGHIILCPTQMFLAWKNESTYTVGNTSSHQQCCRHNRAVYTRESKPRITQSAAYVSRELLV